MGLKPKENQTFKDELIRQALKPREKGIELKKCCKECGFPIDLPRKPVFLKDDIFSILNYENDKCEGCGHQKNGCTILSVYNHIRNIRERILKAERERVKKAIDELRIKQRENDQEIVNLLTGKISNDLYEEIILQLGMSQVLIDETKQKLEKIE